MFQQRAERREQSVGAGDVIKMLRVFPGRGSAMHTHVRAATVLLRHRSIKNHTSCKLHSNTDASSLTAVGGKGKNGRMEKRKNIYIYIKKNKLNIEVQTPHVEILLLFRYV